MKKVFFVILLILPIVCYLLLARAEPDFLGRMCKGSARCFYGTLDQIVDGDTLVIDGETVRLALVNTPEKEEDDYDAAIEFLESICPIRSEVVVDEDDLQTSRSHRRIMAVVYCQGDRVSNLNEELLDSGYAWILDDFCGRSEFASEEWARYHGC